MVLVFFFFSVPVSVRPSQDLRGTSVVAVVGVVVLTPLGASILLVLVVRHSHGNQAMATLQHAALRQSAVLWELEDGLQQAHGRLDRQVGEAAIGDDDDVPGSAGRVRVKAQHQVLEPFLRVHTGIRHFLEVVAEPFHDSLVSQIAAVRGRMAAAAAGVAPGMEGGADGRVVIDCRRTTPPVVAEATGWRQFQLLLVAGAVWGPGAAQEPRAVPGGAEAAPLVID